MEFLNSRVARLKQELNSGRSTVQNEEEPNDAEDISREDLLHLSMKLSRRLKVTDAARAKLETEATAYRNRAETLAKFVSLQIFEDPSTLDDFAHEDSAKIDEIKALEERLVFCWEKRKLEMTAVEKNEKEDELRAALSRAVQARDEIAQKLRASETARAHEQSIHEEQIVYLRMRVESQKQREETDETMNRVNEKNKAQCDAFERQIKQLEIKVENARESVNERDSSICELKAQVTRLEAERNEAEQRNVSKTREALSIRDKLETATRAKKKAEIKLLINRRQYAISSALSVAALASVSAQAAASLAQVYVLTANTQSLALALDEEKQNFAADAARRSALARQIVVDKEADIAKLAARCAELEADAASGGHAHRRIVELAQTQAHRDAANNAELRNLRLANIKLQRALKKRDADLDLLSKRVSLLSNQLDRPTALYEYNLSSAAVGSTNKPKNLDMEYLKNVILQYLSLPTGSSERSSLVPVLATVLHFSDADLRTLQKAHHAAASTSTVQSFFSGLRAVSPPPPLSARVPRSRVPTQSPSVTSAASPSRYAVDIASSSELSSGGEGRDEHKKKRKGEN